MAEEIKMGDVVQLKGGGPKMTVKMVGVLYDPSQVVCQWFTNTKLEEGAFAMESLRKVGEAGA